ncbi:MAG: glycosyltransferase family 2 protein [Acidobacteriota bacterium]|nr:glycosyltransferase family 2 protein [Acidobacteriota bacterium]
MSSPKVAAVVLNYQAKELTLETLASLAKLRYENLEVIVVDNASGDDSHEAVMREFPEADAIQTEVNLGVAGGLNVGIRRALEKNPDFVLVLNNDIEVDPWMLEELVKVAEADPKIACVGPKSYYYWDRQRLWSTGGVLRFKESITRERGNGQLDEGQFDRDEEVEYINGCAMLVRASVVREVGLCDPIYFLALEDADWCVRMRRKGYRCHFAHKAVLWHMVSQSTGVYRPFRTYQTGRSTAIFVRRYANFGQWASFLFFMTLAIPAAFVRELVRGNQTAAVSKLRGVLAGLRVSMTKPPRAPGS